MQCSIGIRIIFWIYLLIRTVHGQTPLPNAVAKINSQTMLECNTSDLTVSNWRRSPDGTIYSTIATGCNPVTGNDAAYYRTELLGSNICRLVISNATMQLAGVYNCYDGTSTIYKSLVTVIDPVASIVVYNQSEVVEGDHLTISCSIKYNGPASPAPSLRPLPHWTTSPGQIFINTTNNPSTNIVTLTATVTVQKPTFPIFQCWTVFEITGNTNGYNTIPPSDNFTVGSTAELDVQYTPSKPSSASRPDVIMVNGFSCGVSVLTCSNSTGNPAPNYRWFDSAENVIISSTNTLTLAEVNRNYKCEAYNTIRDEDHNASTTYTISNDNCASTVQCCVFPHDETTSITVKGCDNGTLCDCSEGSSGIILTCNAKTFPNASYMWTGPGVDIIYSSVLDRVQMNGEHHCVAYFNESLTNYTGDVKFPNGTNETTVESCSNPGPSTTPITHLPSTTTPDNSSSGTADQQKCGGICPPEIIGIVIAVIVILNGVATCLFFWYYKKVEVSHSGKKERNNKLRLDRRFTWLKKMMPCVSETKESAGSNCLWVSLFLLLGIVTGIVTFPIWIIIANKYEKNNETSALNKRENGEGNGSGENGRRPTNISSANHNQPPPTNQMNPMRREDPYQNESSLENIELNNSLRSRNLLLSDSPPSRPPPAGRPPPPPNKPIINSSTNRSKDYTVNDQQTQAANPEHTTYADLPFVPRNTLPTATPVQFLNVSNDTYASLNKT